MDEEPPYIGGKGMGPRRARGSKSNLLQGVGRQSSAVNLTKLGRDSDLKRLIDEVGSTRVLVSRFVHALISLCHCSSTEPGAKGSHLSSTLFHSFSA